MRIYRFLPLVTSLLLVFAIACDAPFPDDEVIDLGDIPEHTPEWVTDASVYEIYVRDFTDEGTFEAMIPRLDELQELGINTLWLMPIHPIGEEERKGTYGSPYSVLDFYAINPDYGDEDSFRQLVEEVHERDMKIILDLVANHTAWDNAWADDNPDWYVQDDDGDFVIPHEDWTDVIELDYDNDEVREEMTRVMQYWVEEFNIDGYRADVAELVPGDFWADAIPAVREINEEVMMLAEGDDPGLYEYGFDLTYSWEPYRKLIEVYEDEEPVADFASVVEDERSEHPYPDMRFRFTTNHDETAWDAPPVELFDSIEGSKAAAASLLLLPGVPMLYNGQEVGVDETLDFFEDNTIDWDANPELREWYANLLNTRNEHEALRRGAMTWLSPGEQDAVIFSRETDDQAIFVMANVRNRNTVYRLPTFLHGAVFNDLLTGDEHDSVEVVLRPYQVRIFEMVESP